MATTAPESEPRRTSAAALGFAALGAAAMAAGIAFGSKGAAVGAVVFALSVALGFRETKAPILTWPNAFLAFIAIVWLVPIKLYQLPVHLPFSPELYRLAIVVLLVALIASVLTGRASIDAAGHGKPLALLAFTAIVSQFVNAQQLDATNSGDSLKSLSYFLSYLIVFLLICSCIRTVGALELVVKALVIGAAIVGAAAVVQGQTRYNVFDHLNQWLPGFNKLDRNVLDVRGGRLRVNASAQHPIALGCALTMMVPFALYLASQAQTAVRRGLWILALLVIAAGALVTVSRTVVLMGIMLLAVALWLRPRVVVRLLPLLVALAILVQVAAPGTASGLLQSFFPQEGLVSDLSGRAGQSGSGRLADVGPGLTLWRGAPIVGHGLGSLGSTGDAGASSGVVFGATSADATPFLIFDDQYLNTLVTLGIVGIVGAVWFIWGAAVKLAATARKTTGRLSDLVAAAAAACAAFGVSMFTFDAFAFVQCTIIFFLIAGLGLRARAMVERLPVEAPSGAAIGREST